MASTDHIGTASRPETQASAARRGRPHTTLDHCRRCQYPLADLPEDAPCPECGSPHRQSGPNQIIGDHFIRACGCVLIGVCVLLMGFMGVWPFLLAVPLLGLGAIVSAHLEHRARRRLELPRSIGTIIVSILGWFLFLPITAVIGISLIFIALASISSTP